MLLISNPVSGSGSGPAFIQKYVLPLLAQEELVCVETRWAGDAGERAVDYVKSRPPHPNPIIAISGGDGTLHEVINGLVQRVEAVKTGSIRVEIILLPLGTANALYYSLYPPKAGYYGDIKLEDPEYKLLSLNAYLSQGSRECRTKSLAVQTTSVSDASRRQISEIMSVVVASTSLHASILDTADRLRIERPDLEGLERFKVAAGQNITNWYYSDVELIALPKGGGYLKYDPSAKQFKPSNLAKLEGPFEYFVSTVNVDRLESEFRIAPLQSRLPTESIGRDSYMDIIIVRPFRHPSFKDRVDNEIRRKEFVNTSMAVLKNAYKDGGHVELRYGQGGTVSDQGNGDPIVEYYRCGGWRWTPENDDTLARLICVDGTIVTIPAGGKATCTLMTGSGNGVKLTVWV